MTTWKICGRAWRCNEQQELNKSSAPSQCRVTRVRLRLFSKKYDSSRRQESMFRKKLHKAAGLLALRSFLPVTFVWKNAVPFSQSPPKPGTRVHRRAQEHHCRLTPHQTHGRQALHCREASACAILPWVQRVTSCCAVVQSPEPTKPTLLLGH